jgi:2-keto-4-pentenoate hydratase
MVAADFARGLAPEEERSWLAALVGEQQEVDLDLVEGEAELVEGVIAGGCLSLLASSLGTPYEAALAGSLGPTALAAIGAVAPAMEIIDSRYRDFRFSLTDVVADNSSSSALVVGTWIEPTFDLGDLALELAIDGEVRQTGSSAAILGHPLESLLNAARLVADRGESLEPGDIVMAGAATAAEALAPGQYVRAHVDRLGEVHFRVTD